MTATIEDTVARTQRLARALEAIAEMGAQVGPECSAGVGVCAEWPAAYYSWPPERQRAWAVANPVHYAKPHDPEDLARAVEKAHANWKESKDT